jgi:transposase
MQRFIFAAIINGYEKMTQEELFAKALLVDTPWFIKEIKFDLPKGQLDIFIDFERGSIFEYQDKDTGIKGQFKAYDTCEKIWRHLNFFQYKCYLHAYIPRVDIGNGKVRQIKAPWEGLSNGFTLLFEALALQLVKLMPVHQVASLLGTYDLKLWNIMHAYTDKCRETEDFSTVKRIGVDETAARRGHDYVSLFVDLDQKKTIFVTEGKGSETVEAFAKDLKAHKGVPEQIEEVSCDMSPSFIKGVNAQLPQAYIVFDHFHIVKIINEAVDKVRKEEALTNPLLKSNRYLFLKNRKNHTVKQKLTFDKLSLKSINLKTMKAYHIKETFQQIYQASTSEEFLKLLNKWYYWATHSRLEPIKEAAYTIKRHWYGIVNWIFFKIDNGILEGFNSIFQAAKAKARGYKSTATIKTIIYILTGKLDFAKINPACATHSLL